MKVIVERESLRSILKWGQRALNACAFLLLGYCAFAVVDSWIYQKRESGNLDRQLRDKGAARTDAPQPRSSPSPKGEPAIPADGLVGRMEIPRLQMSAVVIEGIGATTLRRAVGHVPGTAFPGRPGNVGLAGHRDTFFRPLQNLRVKDEVRFSTLQGNFKYEVVELWIVEPEDIGVFAPTGENVLTMVTCYPFYFVGPAPKRWIVRARQVSPQTVHHQLWNDRERLAMIVGWGVRP